MPDYRKLHNAAGHSQKIASLTDFEFRVWCQYRASADDYGVCPFLPAKLQGDNRRLALVPTRKVRAAMQRVVEVGLADTFEHQGQTYLYQGTWQDYEDLRWPRKTTHPAPPAEVFPKLSGKTIDLLLKCHGSLSEEFRCLARAGGREAQTLTETLTQTEAQTTPEPRVHAAPSPRPHPASPLAWERRHGTHEPGFCAWVCLPSELVEEFSGRLPASYGDGRREAVLVWARGVREAWAERPVGDESIFAFWKARWQETHGTTKARPVAAKDDLSEVIAELNAKEAR